MVIESKKNHSRQIGVDSSDMYFNGNTRGRIRENG